MANRWSLGLVVLCSMGLVLLSNVVYSIETTSLTVQLRPTAGAGCLRAIAAIARPRLVRRDSAESMATFIRRLYGRDDTLLQKLVSSGLSDDRGFPGFVVVPEFALDVVSDQRTNLTPAASVSAIAASILGAQDPRTLGQIANLNKSPGLAKGIAKAGESIMLPAYSRPKTVLLRAGVSIAQAQDAIRQCGPDAIQWLLHGEVHGSELGTSKPGDPVISPFWAEMARANAVSALSVVDVGVIDTGIPAESDVGLWHNPDELGGIAGVDDDNNGYVDDVFGVDIVELGSRPIADGPDSHGGRVAAIVCDTLAGKKYDSLRIMPIKVGDARSVSMEAVQAGARYGMLNGADILNLSLESHSFGSGDRDPLRVVSDHTLIVVAAGNGFIIDGVRHGVDVEDESIYPALLGGPSSTGIITVASLGQGEALATYSNFGATKVDIAAPGALSDSTTEAGTSFSAALVSGVAGWLRAFGVKTPRQIKTRMLSACSVHPALSTVVWMGCTLDLRKVFIMAHDVIEKVDGQILVGSLQSDEQATIWTDRGSRPLSAVRKLVVDGGSAWALFGSAGAFRVERLRDGAPSLRLKTVNGDVIDLAAGEWKDLVTAYP